MISQMDKYIILKINIFLNIKKKLSNMKLNDNSLLHLHFALGKAYGDQKKYSLIF